MRLFSGLLLVSLLAGCTTVAPVNTEQGASFVGANSIVVTPASGTPEAAIAAASARLAAGGWAIETFSPVTLTTAWRRVGRGLWPREARVVVAALSEAGETRLVVRGQQRSGPMGQNVAGSPADVTMSADRSERQAWDAMVAAALELGSDPVYGRR